MTPGDFLTSTALLLVGGMWGYGAACVQASIEHERTRCRQCGVRLCEEAET